MHWRDQINAVCRKLAFSCYALVGSRQYFPRSLLRCIYFSLFHSHLGYCCEAWGLTYKTYLRPILQLQKRALRIITFSPFHYRSGILFNDLHILSFTALRNYKVTCPIHKILYTNFPLPNTIFNFPRANIRKASHLKLNLPPCNNVYSE